MTARRQTLRYAGIYAALAPFLLIALFPVVWMSITAFKHERDLYSMKFPLWFHLPPTLKHFGLLFSETWFGVWVLNTALVSAGAVGITLLVAVPAAYALARLRLPGSEGTGIAGAQPRWPLRFVLGARGAVPDLHDPIQHVAHGGFFPLRAPRARRRGLARRLRAGRRLAARRAAGLPARDCNDGDLRVQPVDAGVSLRGRLRLSGRAEGDLGGSADDADPRR